MTPTGEALIGGEGVAGLGRAFRAVDARTGEALEPPFQGCGPAEVGRACALAEAAFDPYRSLAPDRRAGFIDRIAAELEAVGPALIARAMAETGLPQARLTGELRRTCGQLRLLAAEVVRGDFLGLRIDRAQPDRRPLPAPDLRLRHVPLGAVAVFGASNFPLAFSVAGGDTAAALAAGCPVVAKGHPLHPGAGELAGRAIVRAAAATGMPAGVFALLPGEDHALGEALVDDPRIAAVGFTGSRQGGLALMRRAQARPTPIPVFAEMSSVNPVLILPGALARHADALAEGYAASVMLGAGQFCTNPGLLLAIEGRDLDRFAAAAAEAVSRNEAQVMLGALLREAYEAGSARLQSHPQVRLIATGQSPIGPTAASARLFRTRADAVIAHPALAEEVFGPASLIVGCETLEEMRALLAALEGQLTLGLHVEEADQANAERLLPLLERKAGRVLVGGWPTGVEVARAMVHGGPYPATSDGRSTSVGSLAIDRFLRPVCYQGFPDNLLPAELRNGAAGPQEA